MPDVLHLETLVVRKVAPTWEPADLRELIEEEEAALSARLGTPLVGPITETLYGSGYGSIRVSRPILDLVSITDATIDVLPYVRFRGNVLDVDGYWAAPQVIVYNPADVARIRSALVDLCILRTDPNALYENVSGRDFSRSTRLTVDERREQIYASLLPGQGIGV